jgi:NitT/TauT family transport system permease protein
MYFDIGLTTSEMLVGLLLGSALGTVLGLSLWLNARMGRLFVPYIVIGGSIPIVAVAPILIMWFGTGFVAKVVLACFSTFLVAATQAFEGAQAADAERLDFAKALRATRTQMVTKIVFPSALLWVFAGLRLNVGFALIAVFIGEFVSSEAGVGRYIMRNGGLYDIPRVLFGVGILAGLALAVNALTGYLVRLWVPAGLAAAGSNE